MQNTKKQKEELISDLSEKLGKAKAALFADYTGLTVAQITSLRNELRKENISAKVAKKTLIDLALKKAGLAEAAKKMPGQVILITGENDEVAPAKISYKFSRKNDKLKILGGLLNGNFIDLAGVMALAKLPSREQLLASVVGTIAAPLSGLVGVLQGNLRGFVRVLSQIKK